MTSVELLAAAAGAVLVGGLLLLATGLIGTTRPRRLFLSRRARQLRAAILPGRSRVDEPSRWAALPAIAVALGLIGWLLTSWPVAGVILAGAALGLPHLFRSLGAQKRRIARLEALEEWTRRLANILDTGRGLDTALMSSATGCPAAIAPEVQTLARRMQAGARTEDALRAFADDLNGAVGDLVAAALILANHLRGEGTSRVLTGLSETVADEVVMRRKIEADRAKPRTTARLLVIITLATAVVLSLATDFMAPFGTATGQIALALIALFGAGCLWWLYLMAVPQPDPRFLVDSAPRRRGRST